MDQSKCAPVGCLGFWKSSNMFYARKYVFTKIIFSNFCSSWENLSNTKPGHTTGGSGRGGARRSGGAVRGGTGRRRVGSPRRQPFLLPSGASETTVLNVFSLARTKEIPFKPMGEQNPRLSAVDPRLITGLSAGRRPLFVPGWGPMCRRIFVFVNLLHARHFRELFLDMPCMKRVYSDAQASVHWSAATN